jgi:hypothetical protein
MRNRSVCFGCFDIGSKNRNKPNFLFLVSRNRPKFIFVCFEDTLVRFDSPIRIFLVATWWEIEMAREMEMNWDMETRWSKGQTEIAEGRWR